MTQTGERVLLVTGASRGIGAATARLAARSGWSVAVNYRSGAAEAERVVEQIREQGGKAFALQADVGSEADVVRMFAELDERPGRIAGLVNSAGITGGASRVADVSAPTLEAVLRVNVIGTILCAREAVKRMALRAGGSGGGIVNVGSIAARLGAPGIAVHYAASKGAVEAFTRGLAMEVAADGIRVNAVSPGVIDTDMHASVGLPDRARQAAPTIPLGRAGTAEEVAETILWLLSPQSSYVAGAILEVAGAR